MQVSSAASTVLNAAAPLAVASVLGGPAPDAISPFADMLQSLQGALAAPGANGALPPSASQATAPSNSSGSSSGTPEETEALTAAPSSSAIRTPLVLQHSPIPTIDPSSIEGSSASAPASQASVASSQSGANATTDAPAAASPARKASKSEQPKATPQSSSQATASPVIVLSPLAAAAIPTPAPTQTQTAASSIADASSAVPAVHANTAGNAAPKSAAAVSPTGSLAPPQTLDEDAETDPAPVASTVQSSVDAVASKAAVSATVEQRAASLPAVDASMAVAASGNSQGATSSAARMQNPVDPSPAMQQTANSQTPQSSQQAAPVAAAQAPAAPQPTAASRTVFTPSSRFRAGPNAVAGNGKSTESAALSSESASTGGVVADAQQGSAAQDLGVATAAIDPRLGDHDDPSADQGQPDAAAAAQAGFGGALPTAVETAQATAAPTTSGVSTTVANLSAQIAQKAGGQSTRFDLQLDPMGLGRVNVSVEIDAKGVVSAALSFEKPEAASLLRAHAADLQQSLAQAGFNLSDSSLSFSTAAQPGTGSAGQTAWLGTGADGGGQQPQNGQAQGGQSQTAGRAFGAAGLAADQADQIATTARTLSARGLDIRI